MSNTPKWTEERVSQLEDIVGGETPVSRATVTEAAEQLATSTRSISSKLRKLGFDVELASAAPRAFSEEATDALRAFVLDNSGQLTYGDIAERFPGDYTSKAIQGKILAMELTSHVKPTPKKETPKTYTEEEEVLVLKMIRAGAYVEDIAEAVGKSIQSVRGKALSFHRAGEITSVPKQKNIKGPTADPLDQLGDVSALTVEEIAGKIDKTARGVKTMLTRRGLVAKDYDGATKKEKAAASN